MQKDIIGIILKDRDYGESSKILDVLTKEYGIIGVISKGSKKIKSNLSGVSSKLAYGTFHIYYKEGKLSTLTSVDIINPFIKLKSDIISISFASYLSELTFQVVKQSNQSDEIFDLYIEGLKKINESYNPMVITNILELKYLDYLGVSPLLDSCSICGSKTDIVTLSYSSNGLVCKNCKTNERLYDLKTIKYLRMYKYLDVSKISKIDMDKNVIEEINKFLNEYYEYHTGIYLNSKKFIDDLRKVDLYN